MAEADVAVATEKAPHSFRDVTVVYVEVWGLIATDGASVVLRSNQRRESIWRDAVAL